ncbi:MAG: ABC transporter ATP-binding protein [Planctomycetes bacterium]|nr:ABC transporter ATP-binding protein [Planctomycetota bacterium]
MPEPLLEIEDLSKTFRRRVLASAARGGIAGADDPFALQAVDRINLTVERGDVFGFLGPNGAGKSTTIRMALGLIHPTSGRVRIGGYDLATDRLNALRKVGAFVEAPAFYSYLTGRKNLEIFAGLSGRVPDALVDETIDLVGLRGREHERVNVYSHGMKARLGIAACLLPRPELMILDEPTDGLDPHGIREIRELIKRLARQEGLTVFLSSHLLNEVENLCNRIAIVERGSIILQGRLDELEKTHRRLRIQTDKPQESAALLRERFKIEARPDPDARASLLVMPNGHATEELNAALSGAGHAVRHLAPEEAWLDRLFLELTTTKESSKSSAPMAGESLS